MLINGRGGVRTVMISRFEERGNAEKTRRCHGEKRHDHLCKCIHDILLGTTFICGALAAYRR